MDILKIIASITQWKRPKNIKSMGSLKCRGFKLDSINVNAKVRMGTNKTLIISVIEKLKKIET